MAGFMLSVYPGDQLRVTIAIYALSRAAEFAYNLAEDEGWIWGKFDRPWWWGSWMLMPLASGQLLHAFVFDRDCFPKVCFAMERERMNCANRYQAYGDFILKNSPQYIQRRPVDYPAQLPWPGTFDIVDNLAEMARLNYPSVSPNPLSSSVYTYPILTQSQSIHLPNPLPHQTHPPPLPNPHLPHHLNRPPHPNPPHLRHPPPSRPLLPPHLPDLLAPRLPLNNEIPPPNPRRPLPCHSL